MPKSNYVLSETVKEEKILNLFNIFPVGMMIFEKILKNNITDFKLKYINETALKTLKKSVSRSEEDIKMTLKKFNKLHKFSTLTEVYSDMNDVSEENLYNRIFDDLDQTETDICERYVSMEIMIYVKIKIHQEYKLVTIENFNDERIAIQNNIIKNIKTQNLLTLSHELNNPLNSLSHSVNEIILKKEEEKADMKLVDGMKINLRLIKFFIKNFIFSLKMSFDMHTIIQESDIMAIKTKESCINLEYLFRKIKEKYSIFIRSKRITLDINFNPIGNIFVTYDYDYFNSMIKNIFMYLFYRIERKGGVKVEFVFENELKIMFKKYSKHKPNYSNQRLMKPQSHLDTSFVSEFNIESSVITLKILYDIIHKFAVLLGIRLKIIEDESPCYLIMYLKYGLDEDLSQVAQDVAEEFTGRNSKKNNTKLLSRIFEIHKDINYSFMNRSCFNPLINVIDQRHASAILLSNNSKNINNNSFIWERENIRSDEVQSKAGCIKSKKIIKPDKLNRFSTDYKNIKSIATINSDKEFENKKNLHANKSKPKTMFMRSNFTFKYILNSDNDVNMKVDLHFDKNKTKLNKSTNLTYNDNFCQQKNSFDISPEINMKTGQILTINNMLNASNNVTSVTNRSKTPKYKKVFFNDESFPMTDSRVNEADKKLLPLTKKNAKICEIKNSLVAPINSMQLINDSSNASHFTERNNPEILVVDDDNFNLIVLQTMLKRLKLSSDTCMNGQECLNLLMDKYEKGIEYKLILMDVMMPIMDGIEASTKIDEMVKNGKLNSNIKIIIISAHNNQDIINRATKLSVVAEFKCKPVKQTDIQGIIQNYYK